MKWISSLHVSESLETALHEASVDLKKKLGRAKADLGFIFISYKFREEIVDLWASMRNDLPIKTILGCTAGGVIGGKHEIEDKAAVSLTVGVLPKVKIGTFHIHQDELPDLDGSPQPWRELVGVQTKDAPQFLLMSDPFSIDSDKLVEGLDFAFPQSVKIGGLASGGMAPDENLLLLNERVLHKGVIGASLSGNIQVESVVAQGCRPIGKPLTITNCQDNVLLHVNDKPPLKYLSELYSNLSPRDQSLLSHSLFVGLAMDSFKEQHKQGDFLVRNIIGLDQEKGILAVGAMLRKGQTIQFHLRDANTSHDDLQLMLSKSETAGLKSLKPAQSDQLGAVLFSCLGRGKQLYGKPDHDISLVKTIVGDIPVGGFFCNGEIGPISGRTYLHGYTSSIAFFRPNQPVESK